MNFGITLLGLAMACMTVAQPEARTQTRRFRLNVPAYAATKQTHLLLRDVAAPRNLPLRLRVYAVGSDNARVYFGSTAIPGISRTDSGMTSFSVLRINVTTGFRRWLTTARSSRKVDIEIIASFGTEDASPRPRWSIRAAELVNPD